MSCLILFICKVQDRPIQRDRKCMGGCQKLAGRGHWEGLPGGCGAPFPDDKNVLELATGDGGTSLGIR